MIEPGIIAAAALVIAATVLWCGARDLTRPAVAFGVPWFAFAALAQLRLTPLEERWSLGFTLVVFGGGLALIVAAVLAGGTAPVRGTVTIARESIQPRRLVTAALILIAGAIVGAAYKAHVLGGIPLLSANPDEVRGRVFQVGQTVLPSWSSFLTSGFYIGMWTLLAAIWAVRGRTSRLRIAALWLLALFALFGVATEASRNLVVFALAIPAIGAYILTRPGGTRGNLAWILGAICALGLGVGGLYVVRLARGDTAAHNYVQRELDRQPAALRPLLPVYLNGVYPFEAARRVYGAVPGRLPYDVGAASLSSLPSALFPDGKSSFPRNVADLMTTPLTRDQLTWTVAGYEGKLIADLGWLGVVFGSVLIGLAFGSLHRWARGRSGFLPAAVVAYFAYYSAYMVYDNFLSFSVVCVYDLAVVALVGAYAMGWTGAVTAALRELRGRLVAG
jgi:hypothetical protein